MLLSANVLAFTKVLTQLKTAQQYLVVVVNHGVKKELDALVAVESLSFAAPKTAEFANVLSALNVDSKVLVILEEGNEFAALSARNLPNVKVATATTASVLDIVNSDKLLVTKEAISTIEEVLA